MTDPYDFKDQLKIGAEGEAFLDEFFDRAYEITPATSEEQRLGIDRHFVNRETGNKLTVEYKTDEKAQKYHNAFVETISVDQRGKSDWAYTSHADRLIYYVVGDELIYVLHFIDLRKRLPEWAAKYPTGRAKNKGYWTYGLLVPLHEFERCAVRVFSV